MPRTSRRSRNQALFRDVNDRIAELAASHEGFGETQGFICECSQMGCTAQVQIPVHEYARLRENPCAFLVLPGHEDAAHEDVLSRRADYLVVQTRANAKPSDVRLRDARPDPAAEVAS
jgi:hypothetical protein